MTPSPSDATFWAHVPQWMWPVIMLGILGFFLYEAIKTSESVARIFGRVGHYVRNRAVAPRIERIESLLASTSDKLECATTYLVFDADYHHNANIVIAERAPTLFQFLPKRIPYTEFCRMWQEGWRP